MLFRYYILAKLMETIFILPFVSCRPYIVCSLMKWNSTSLTHIMNINFISHIVNIMYFSDFCDVGGLSINRGESQKF